MPGLVPARHATRTHFFVCGALFATWGVQIPAVKRHFGLDDAGIAMLLLVAGVGAIVALTRVGRWVARHGTRPVVLVSGAALAGSLALVLWTPASLLYPLMFLFGLSNGAFDVAMNAEAVAVERHAGRPIMSAFHGFFSLGGMAGAGLGSLVAVAGVSPVAHLALASAVGFAAVTLATRFMLPDDQTRSPEPAASGLRLPPSPILLLGALAALGLVGEGAMYDWSTLYLADTLQSPQSIAALAYGSFSAAMAAGRFGGDAIRARLGAQRTIRASAVLAAGAMAATLWIASPWAAIAGFALVGLGFANLIPILFSASAAVPGVTPAEGIAGVSSCGYIGFMIGPPLIGALANDHGLGRALLVVAVFAAVVAVLSHRATRHLTARPGRP